MIKYQFSLAILLFIVASYAFRKEFPGCDDVRQGRFSFHGHFVDTKYIVERNDSLQIETDKKNRIIFRKKIRWVNDCEYELTYISGQSIDTFAGGRVRIFVPKKKTPLRVKILKVEKSYYLFETTDTNDQPYQDTMWILK